MCLCGQVAGISHDEEQQEISEDERWRVVIPTECRLQRSVDPLRPNVTKLSYVVPRPGRYRVHVRNQCTTLRDIACIRTSMLTYAVLYCVLIYMLAHPAV